MKKSISFRTYAKINLSLDVIGVRENGYHEVEMVMQGIDLYDLITVRIFPSDTHKITLKTDKFYIPVDERNTAYKAAAMIQNDFSFPPSEIRIDMKKNIPVSAGLAGGSSNGAGVLLALNYLLNLNMTIEELCTYGAAIGADVPFAIRIIAEKNPEFGLSGGMRCALATGVGELLTGKPAASLWCVLAKLPLSVSTAKVYRELDQCRVQEHPQTEMVLEAIAEGNLQHLKASMGNVLENVTLQRFPQVAELKSLLQSCSGAEAPVLMSGSGPTVYALFSEETAAREAEQKLKKQRKDRKTQIFCVKTI